MTTLRSKRGWALLFALVAAVVIAKTWGPFKAGFPYYSDTYPNPQTQQRFRTDWQYQGYPKMKPGDRVRVEYTDGVVMEYKLAATSCNQVWPSMAQCLWSTTIPLEEEKLITSENQPAGFDFPDGSATCSGVIWINTGYWGQNVTVTNPTDPSSGAVITAMWIDTGKVALKVARMNCI